MTATAWRQDYRSWGGVVADARHLVLRPAHPEEAARALAEGGDGTDGGAPLPALAWGCGRSYGDVALNPGGRLLDCRGLDRFVAFDKGRFIGREAATAERDGKTARQRLVTLEVDAVDADASGFEPVWHGRRRIGFVTSGGYGHTVGKSLAMAYVDRELAAIGTELAVHVVGDLRPCRVIAPSPHDTEGKRLRA